MQESPAIIEQVRAQGGWLGIKEVDEGIWIASFMHYDLGYFDLEQKTLQNAQIEGPQSLSSRNLACKSFVLHTAGVDSHRTLVGGDF